jgi:hypothetical protein
MSSPYRKENRQYQTIPASCRRREKKENIQISPDILFKYIFLISDLDWALIIL